MKWRPGFRKKTKTTEMKMTRERCKFRLRMCDRASLFVLHYEVPHDSLPLHFTTRTCDIN
jgi:hypothetical protein